jgi:riboflavin kinase/FMN adenylyltransferase
MPRLVLTIGVFDGVHRGHGPILRKVVARARAIRGTACAMTFDGHPSELISPQYSPPLLATAAQKLELLAKAGLDAVILLKFDRAFASLEAGDFVERVLVRRLGLKELVVGYDFVFGRQGLGNLELLRDSARKHGFRLSVAKPVMLDGEPVSSTRIRSAILAGDMAGAARLLGRPWLLRGKVVAGDKVGRSLGFPTANLEMEETLLPKAGVWGGRARVLGRPGWLPFLANLGTRPTFMGTGTGRGSGKGKGQAETRLELHLLGFQGKLYGREMEAEFQRYLRPERKFVSPAALVEQIGKDRQAFLKWRRGGRGTAPWVAPH